MPLTRLSTRSVAVNRPNSALMYVSKGEGTKEDIFKTGIRRVS